MVKLCFLFNISGPLSSIICKRLRTEMKKTIVTLLLILTTALSVVAGPPKKLEKLARQYKNVEGFEMVSIGRLGLSLMRGVMNVSGDLDAEDRATLQALKGVKSLTIIDFEDTSEDRKKAFGAQVETILSEMEMILEAKDEGDAVRIFGTEDGDRIRDIILYSRDGTLLITKGIIDVGQLGSLADMAQ